MKGDDLLLRHLAALPAPDEEVEEVERPPARERLEAALGRDLAGSLVAALTAPRA
jgi:hypothetical protein